MNSDSMAACLQREEARVALAELREVMQRHNLSIVVTDRGDTIEALVGHNVVKTIDCGQLDAESLQDD